MSAGAVGAGIAVALAILASTPRRLERSGAAVPRLLALLVLAAVAVLVPPGVVGAVVVAAVGGGAWWRLRRRQQQAAATASGVLEACELLTTGVAAGQPPQRALEDAAGAWPPLASAARADALGAGVPASLRGLAERPGAGDLRLVAAAWEVAHRGGGGLADALTRVANSLRADRASARVVEGELASARATARLIAALPIVMLVLGSGADQSGWRFLLLTPAGAGCLAAGLALGLLGLWWIERIASGVSTP